MNPIKDFTAFALCLAAAFVPGCASVPDNSAKTDTICMEYSAQVAAGLGTRFARVVEQGKTREVEYTRLTRGACPTPGAASTDKVVYEGPESGIMHTREGRQVLPPKHRSFLPDII